MSRTRSARLGRAADDGFTVIELIVSLTILALASAAMVPVMIIGTAAAAAAKMHTQAKALAQQRLEQMHDLQFHVDRQNGPFVDLLDLYYTDLAQTATTRTRGPETMTGQFVPSGTGSAGEPSTPFYRVKVDSLPGFPRFSQTIDTQFLNAAGAVLPASALTGYDSQQIGNDAPPTLLVGITVLTNWTLKGSNKVFSEYTRLADGRGVQALLTSHAKAEAIRASSAGSAGNSLLADVAQVETDGSQTTGSTSSVSATAFDVSDSSASVLSGVPANGISVSPGTTPTPVTPASPVQAGSGTCGWTNVGRTSVSNITSGITNGLPVVPSDVDSNNPPLNQASVDVSAAGVGCGGNAFGFNNQSSSYDSSLGLQSAGSLVSMADVSGGSSLVRASAWQRATDPTLSTRSVTSGSGVTMAQAVLLFPQTTLPNGRTIPFVASVKVSTASLSCSAATASGTFSLSAAASYTAVVSWYEDTAATGVPTLQTQTVTWSSASGPAADPLPALLAKKVYNLGGVVKTVGTWLSWSSIRAITESPTSGVHALDSVIHVATVPVRAGDASSSVNVDLGLISCVADDNR